MAKEKAKTWEVNEGIKALREGDVKARIDIATRFPLFATATDEEILDEITLMTVRQVEIRMKKKLLGESTEEVEEDIPEEQKESIKQADTNEEEAGKESEEEGFGGEFVSPEESIDIEEVKKPEEVEAEVVEPEEKATEEPKKEPKEDIAEDDLDDIFGDIE